MPYLFDTDAISELFRPKPAPSFVAWIRTVDREEQFASAVSIGELYHGAFRSQDLEHHFGNIEGRVLPSLTILPFDVAVARKYGEIRATLERRGAPLADPDLQIAATAVYHGLELVTGNIRHFARVPDLRLNTTLSEARKNM